MNSSTPGLNQVRYPSAFGAMMPTTTKSLMAVEVALRLGLCVKQKRYRTNCCCAIPAIGMVIRLFSGKLLHTAGGRSSSVGALLHDLRAPVLVLPAVQQQPLLVHTCPRFYYQ